MIIATFAVAFATAVSCVPVSASDVGVGSRPSRLTASFVIRLVCDPVSQSALMLLFHGCALCIVAVAVPKMVAASFSHASLACTVDTRAPV